MSTGLTIANPAATVERDDELLSARYVIDRPAHTEARFRQDVAGPPNSREGPGIVGKVKGYCGSCGGSKLLEILIGLFPILSWLPKYKLKKWLAGDILSGFTVGIVHIPQSLAFAALAGVPPYYGLYVTFYTVLIYTLMGTSRHLSIGTFAIPSVLTQAVVIRFVPESMRPLPVVAGAVANFTTVSSMMTTTAAMMGGETTAASTLTMAEFDSRRVEIASALCMLMGIFQLIFGVCRLGMITTYMSQPVLQGFTTGAALYVVLSQMPAMLGIPAQPRSGIGSFYLSWIYVFKSLPDTHIATLVVSIVCIIILVIGREINERYSDRLKVPIPTEVILVVVFIIASYFGKFKEIWQIKIVDTLPLGFPTPQVPDVSILGQVVGEAIGLAVVGFALNISISKFYAMKFGYPIDSNQELIAYGMTNFIPAFFQCFPNAAALARCQIQVNAGGKTQIVGAITVVILLLTILVAGPIFEPLPKSVLGCIITVGLFGVLKQFSLIYPTFKASPPDGVIWVFTLLAICSLGVDIGLYASIGFAMIVTVLRRQYPSYEVLGSVKGSDVYRDPRTFPTADTTPGIVVFKFNGMLFYVNKDYFKEKLFKACGFNPDQVIVQRRRYASKLKKLNKSSRKSEVKSIEVTVTNGDSKPSTDVDVGLPDPDLVIGDLKVIIIDCSAITMLDIVGVKTIKELQKSFTTVGVEWVMTNVPDDVRNSLTRSDYYADVEDDTEFVSVHDAVLYMQNKHETKTKSPNDRVSIEGDRTSSV